MIRILPISPFKDCNYNDFNHYFAESILVYHLTDQKTRIFIPEGIDSAADRIVGRYLTRLKEWKPIQIKWDHWWSRLSYIPPFPIAFNMSKGAAWWCPNISKQGTGSSGYRKSFPAIYGSPVLRTFGKPTAADKSLQNIIFSAFGPVYKDDAYVFPPLREEPSLDKPATACAGDFIVDRITSQVLYKGSKIGGYTDGKVVLTPETAGFKDLMLRAGASESQIKMQ